MPPRKRRKNRRRNYPARPKQSRRLGLKPVRLGPASDAKRLRAQLAASHSWKHKFWIALHLRALKGALTADWLNHFTRRIPCGGCRRHWREVIAALNPRLLNFSFTVRAHNEINKLLGKKPVTVQSARAFWRKFASPASDL